MVEYKTFLSQVSEVKEDVRKKAFSAKKKPKINLSEDQVRWAEVTIKLMNTPEFKTYLEMEAKMIAESYRQAFNTKENYDAKGNPIPGIMTFGEQMAVNKGVNLGLNLLKTERERIWMAYLNFQKEEGE